MDTPPPSAALGAAIADARRTARMTQAQLGEAAAAAAGRATPWDQTAVSSWERGGALTLDHLAAIEDALALDRGELLIRSGYLAAKDATSAAAALGLSPEDAEAVQLVVERLKQAAASRDRKRRT